MFPRVRALRTIAAATLYALVLLLMYIPPYTLLREAAPLTLYAYWSLLALMALAITPHVLEQSLGKGEGRARAG